MSPQYKNIATSSRQQHRGKGGWGNPCRFFFTFPPSQQQKKNGKNAPKIWDRLRRFLLPASLYPLTSDSVLYCVGVGEDVSHDVELARALGGRVYLFDPTPRAIAHANLVRAVMDDPSKVAHSHSFGGGDCRYWDGILKNRVDPDRIVFTPIGVYSKNAVMSFYQPTNAAHVSCSVVPGMKSSVSPYEVQVKTLRTLMTELHHDRIDLLKLDIEDGLRHVALAEDPDDVQVATLHSFHCFAV
jgi:hypothetical protein